MSVKNLDYICTDTLVLVDDGNGGKQILDRHKGMFVYLTKVDIHGHKPGLWFGGENGWERLTNDSGISIIPSANVPVPTAPNSSRIYDGKTHTFEPGNWSSIKNYCIKTGDVAVDAGEYTMSVYLKYINDSNEGIQDGWFWSDNTNEVKEVKFTINPKDVSSAGVELSFTEVDYDGTNTQLPQVKSVTFIDKELINGVDYDYEYVERDENGSVDKSAGKKHIKIVFKNNYCGEIVVEYTINRYVIDVPVLEKDQYMYTGDVVDVLVKNWDDIKEYCDVIYEDDRTSVGEHEISFKLKDPNHAWRDYNYKTYTLKYSIESIGIALPDWSNYPDDYSLVYDWNEHEILPKNWDDIKEYCDITENKFTNVGVYEVKITLNNVNYKWESDGNTDFTFEITPFKVPIPIWNYIVHDYTGYGHYHKPLNWDDIKEYCEINGDYQIEVCDDYVVTVVLKDTLNYVWDGKYTDGHFCIRKSNGQFLEGPHLTGGNDIYTHLECVCKFTDSTAKISYIWMRSKDIESTPEGNYEIITDNNGNMYTSSCYDVKPEDLGYYIICRVSVSGSNNYNDVVTYTSTRLKITKIMAKDVLSLESYEDSLYVNTKNIYKLPGVKGIIYSEGEIVDIKYEIVSGVGFIDDDKLFIDEEYIGEIEIVVKVLSNIYIYSPSKLKFILNVYSDKIILWGLYDKFGEDSLSILSNGEVPSNYKCAKIMGNDRGTHVIMKRSEYPFNKEDGTEQKYHGWYLLIPNSDTFENPQIDENGGLGIDHESVLIKDRFGNPIIVRMDDKTFKAYGDFNVAKTSDNWMLHVYIRNKK